MIPVQTIGATDNEYKRDNVWFSCFVYNTVVE